MSPLAFAFEVLVGTFGLFQGLRAVVTGEVGDALVGAVLLAAASGSIYWGLT